MEQHTLLAEGVSSGYDGKRIISDIRVAVPEHQISVILGANGCGKSTLLKTFSRLIKPSKGQVVLDGKAITSLSSRQVAQVMGLLPQSPVVPEGIKVTDLVARGRFPYRRPFKSMTKADYTAIEESLSIMNITGLADCSVDELSGGQRQRVWIALALTQQTDILLLDEPTTFLDIAYQVEILELLKELNRRRNTTIVMVLHDINLAARYADHLYAMKEGRLLAEGTAKEIITPGMMKQMYGLESIVIEDPVSKTPLVIPQMRQVL